jgi:hypothetical protein
MTCLKKGCIAISFFFISFTLICPTLLSGAEKKTRKQSSPGASVLSGVSSINGINLQERLELARERLKKEQPQEALPIFQDIYNFTRDTLTFTKCVKAGYEKALNDPGLKQNLKEDVYIKLQRLNSIQTRYSAIKNEAAYNIGSIYEKKGATEQARKYLLEACQTAPSSLDPSSIWMKAKNLLLDLSGLEGEF